MPDGFRQQSRPPTDGLGVASDGRASHCGDHAVNAASLTPGPIASGMLIALLGTGLTISDLPQTQVSFNTIPVPVLSITPTEVLVRAARFARRNRADRCQPAPADNRERRRCCSRFVRERQRSGIRRQSGWDAEWSLKSRCSGQRHCIIWNRRRSDRVAVLSDHRRLFGDDSLRRTGRELSWNVSDQCSGPFRILLRRHAAGSGFGGNGRHSIRSDRHGFLIDWTSSSSLMPNFSQTPIFNVSMRCHKSRAVPPPSL